MFAGALGLAADWVTLCFVTCRCASANGIAQLARSESRMSVLQRRCALMEGLICFFMSRVRGHTSSENPLLPQKAKLRQDLLEKSWKFFSGAMASLIAPEKTEVNGTVLPRNLCFCRRKPKFTATNLLPAEEFLFRFRSLTQSEATWP